MVADAHRSDDSATDANAAGNAVRTEARRQMAGVLASFEQAPLGIALDGYVDLVGMIDAAKARRLAAEQAAERRRGDGKRSPRSGRDGRKKQSRRTKKRDEDRADAVAANPDLADMVEAGELSGEQLDTIAAAMQTDKTAATDQDLIDAVAGSSVEQGRTIGRDWAQKRADKDKIRDEHERQRARRQARQWTNDKGLGVLMLKGDQASIAQAWQHILGREQQLWREDGGRDLAPGEHRRTRHQRLFDAAIELINGRSISTSTGADSGNGMGGATRRRSKAAKPTFVVNLTADPDDCPELVGHGPIPDHVAAEIMEQANLFVRIHDLEGRTLWFGRGRRDADLHQFIALIARDRGCVMCGASWQHCEAHHLMPWNAPARGRTDIDNLALVCSQDHHRLHDNHLTLVRGADGTWSTRPATPDELPPQGPHRQQGRRRKPPPP